MLDGRCYFCTGDLGRVDDEGYFCVTGRLKRMINAPGYEEWPVEVESTLYEHPTMYEAGMSDACRGETVKALLVLKPDVRGDTDANEVIAWARERMAVYKTPRIVEFVEILPKSIAGLTASVRAERFNSEAVVTSVGVCGDGDNAVLRRRSRQVTS